MANKSTSSGFRELLTEINKGNFSPVYILMGEEPYYLDVLSNTLENKVVAEEEKDFNFSIFYGQDADVSNVIAACQQYPFMSDRKLVILKEAQSMDKAKTRLEALADYISHPNESNVFVLVFKGDTLNATSNLMKAAKKGDAVIFNSEKLRDYQLSAPLQDYCRSKKTGIDDKALAMLIEYLGTDLSKLFGEIDKLIVASGIELKRITPDLIERNIGISKDYNNFELQSAIAQKNYDRCMEIIKYFESNPKQNPTIATTGILFRFFSNLIVCHFSQDKSDSGLMEALNLRNSYSLKEYKIAMANYSLVQSVNAIRQLRNFDIKSKGVESFQNEYNLLKELIFSIFISAS